MNQPISSAKPRLLLIVLAYIGFVSLGLPDAVIGVAWPTVRDWFGLPQGALGMVFLASGCGYFLSSFFSGRAVQALGIGLLLATSTALVAASAFGFAVAPLWFLFVACATVHGLGSGAIDAGLNGYAAAHLSARHMNWLHACYCLGAMLGPLLMTLVLTTTELYWPGYVIIGGILLSLAFLFAWTRPLWGQATWAALRQRTVLVHMAVFFLYTGLEVTVGQWGFTVLTEHRGVETATAGIWVSVYWGSIGVGRVLFGLIVERLGIDRTLRGCLFAAALGALLIAVPAPVEFFFTGMVLIGLGLAPVFPCLMTRTPQRLGPALAAHAVGFQVGAAMLGAAAIPASVGLLAEANGLASVGPVAVGLACVLWLLHEVLVRQHA
jgi:fucose permease